MKVTVLSHNLSSNAAMRALVLAEAAKSFAEVTLIGPARRAGQWPALPEEPWINSVRKRRFPEFYDSFVELLDLADGDVLLAVKPQLASFGVALVAGERRGVPVVLDVDDLDIALAPREAWDADPLTIDPSRPGSAVYVSLLTRAAGGAAAVTASSTTLAERFGATLIAHGADTSRFDPALVDRAAARVRYGFHGPTVLFPGTPRQHKGIDELTRAMGELSGATLAVTCRPEDLGDAAWDDHALLRVPVVPHADMPSLLAAADVVAVPQLDSLAGRHQMPMKVYDAMAMARPIVASAVSDLPSLLDGCGVVVPPGEVGALASAIGRLLADPAGAARLGDRARRRCIDDFSRHRIAERLEHVLTSVR
jgi:glycosyltransferase involved in cell wall biosynthesis